MAKRKAQGALDGAATTKSEAFKKVKFNGAEQAAKSRRAPKAKASKAPAAVEATPLTTKSDAPITIQIVAGSYDRILHGVTATIHPSSSSSSSSSSFSSSPPHALPTEDDAAASPEVTFADTFLFNAHTSAIRCLALSPPSAPLPGQSQKVMLASGSTDERINVYNLSAHPPPSRADPDAALLSSLARRPILEDTRNRELGTLLHHSSTVTRLAFPTRSKLLSSSEDSTVAVTRTRDWSLLSTIKAPVPKVFGRPSGDTAPLGGTPSGVNDFAVHPSMKVMISVSKGERCMRLWNLVTGKKAGVLDFGRDLMQEIGEPRHSSGEGRKVVWGSSESEGDEFAVGFDRDVLVFGMDSKPRCRVMPDTRTKVHEFAYVKLDAGSGACVLAVATEDGRILFFSTALEDLDKKKSDDSKASPPRAKLLAQLGGKDAGVAGRVKDFKILQPESTPGIWYIISASSDGKLRAWALPRADLKPEEKKKSGKAKAAGKLLGTYETQNRITCVEAFVMIPRPEGVEESDVELEEPEAESSGDSDDE